MKKIRYLVIHSWTCPGEGTLMLVSRHPVTYKQLDQERIRLIDAAMSIVLTHNAGDVQNSLRRNNAKLKRFLRKCVSEEFEVTEVEGFNIV